MDLIAVDIGNSNISLAVFTQDKLIRSERVEVVQPESVAKILQEMRAACGPQPLGAKTVPVVVSSVNPKGKTIIEQAVSDVLDQNILLVGRDIPLFIKMAVENPESVGSDRLLTAWAAYSVVEDAVVISDFGTATTIDCVNHQGIFLGGVIMPGLGLAAWSLGEYTEALPKVKPELPQGVIMPGLGLAAWSLGEYTAALPKVKPELPQGVYGTNTVTAIQHGICYGAIGALREMVERYATKLGRWPHVVVTGGYGKLIAAKCDFVDSLVPDLCLDGLFLAYRDFRQAQEEKS
jgi:type III pantothenate kinase